MNLSYQATAEDVGNVLTSNMLLVDMQGLSIEDFAETLLPLIDMDKVEQAALFGDDLEEQTDYANDEIADQLLGLGIITILAPEPK